MTHDWDPDRPSLSAAPPRFGIHELVSSRGEHGMDGIASFTGGKASLVGKMSLEEIQLWTLETHWMVPSWWNWMCVVNNSAGYLSLSLWFFWVSVWIPFLFHRSNFGLSFSTYDYICIYIYCICIYIYILYYIYINYIYIYIVDIKCMYPCVCMYIYIISICSPKLPLTATHLRWGWNTWFIHQHPADLVEGTG